MAAPTERFCTRLTIRYSDLRQAESERPNLNNHHSRPRRHFPAPFGLADRLAMNGTVARAPTWTSQMSLTKAL
jgi:hypothetical protein